MIYTYQVQKAILFALETHETIGKQKRKGKDIPYIIHPLTAGIILASAGAKEEVIIAGILHDTIEDSLGGHVTKKIISKNFGEKVAELVWSVTEQNITSSWEDRKKESIEKIKTFTKDSLLLKSADIISNVSEIADDYRKDGDKIFSRFHSLKERTLDVYKKIAKELLNKWPDSPLRKDLNMVLKKIDWVLHGDKK